MDHSTTKKNNIDSFDTYVCIYYFLPIRRFCQINIKFLIPSTDYLAFKETIWV